MQPEIELLEVKELMVAAVVELFETAIEREHRLLRQGMEELCDRHCKGGVVRELAYCDSVEEFKEKAERCLRENPYKIEAIRMEVFYFCKNQHSEDLSDLRVFFDALARKIKENHQSRHQECLDRFFGD